MDPERGHETWRRENNMIKKGEAYKLKAVEMWKTICDLYHSAH